MFIDEAEIYLRAGKGGDGAVSFRREKFVPMGGPDGGDGGDGGSIIVRADNHCHGLALFNRQKQFLAEDGKNGMGQKKKGRNGIDMILLMPPGTQIYANEKLIADLTREGQTLAIAKGGIGGWGNHHFATSIKQTPKWSKKGKGGEALKLKLILKTIADAGLIGKPNSGKSTLLSVISNARPKIADYPFTTLEPNLGTIKSKDKNIIIADIPGLIEGASLGKGLGDKFLRHIERTKTVLHLIDINEPDVVASYRTVRKELRDFSPELTDKKEIVVITKAETVDKSELNKKVNKLKRAGLKPVIISASTGLGLPGLINLLKKNLSLLDTVAP